MSESKSAPILASTRRCGRFRAGGTSTRNSGWYNLCRIHIGIQDFRTGSLVCCVSCSDLVHIHHDIGRVKQSLLPQPRRRRRQALLVLRADKHMRDGDLETGSFKSLSPLDALLTSSSLVYLYCVSCCFSIATNVSNTF